MTNIKSFFSQHHKIIFYILLISVCFSASFSVVHYKNRACAYDLTWPDGTDPNNIVYRKWRYYFESFPGVPYKIEKYSKRNLSDSYALEETLVITYPSDDDIQLIIELAGFGDLPKPDIDMKGHADSNEQYDK